MNSRRLLFSNISKFQNQSRQCRSRQFSTTFAGASSNQQVAMYTVGGIVIGAIGSTTYNEYKKQEEHNSLEKFKPICATLAQLSEGISDIKGTVSDFKETVSKNNILLKDLSPRQDSSEKINDLYVTLDTSTIAKQSIITEESTVFDSSTVSAPSTVSGSSTVSDDL